MPADGDRALGGLGRGSELREVDELNGLASLGVDQQPLGPGGTLAAAEAGRLAARALGAADERASLGEEAILALDLRTRAAVDEGVVDSPAPAGPGQQRAIAGNPTGAVERGNAGARIDGNRLGC